MPGPRIDRPPREPSLLAELDFFVANNFVFLRLCISGLITLYISTTANSVRLDLLVINMYISICSIVT